MSIRPCKIPPLALAALLCRSLTSPARTDARYITAAGNRYGVPAGSRYAANDCGRAGHYWPGITMSLAIN